MLKLKEHLIIAAFVTCATLVALCTTAVAQNLQLNVSPFSGAVSIQNTSGSAVSLDGYEIYSSSAQLVPDPTHTLNVGWDSLSAAGKPGWSEVAPTTSALTELDLTSSLSIPAGGTQSLGFAYTAYGASNVTWDYSVATGGGTSTPTAGGTVHYGGGATLEVLTLLGRSSAVDSTPVIIANVEAQAGVKFDGYEIQSGSGSLNPANFNGFAGHSVAGWASIAPTANALTELNLTVTPTMAGGHFQPLGSIFPTNGTHDLTFDLHAIGAGFGDTPFSGDVVYKTQLAGDTTGDGVVNGLDINAIATNWLHGGQLAGDANYDGIVNGLDINLVAKYWLNTGGGAGLQQGGGNSVPEPSTWALACMAIALGCVRLRRRAAA